MPLGRANRARGGGGGGKHIFSRHFKYYNKVDTAQNPPHFTKLKRQRNRHTLPN